MRLVIAVCWMLALAVVAALAAPAGQTASPRPPPPLVIESLVGEDSFNFYCASCHGRDGKGDGPVARSLKTAPPDLTTLARRSGGAFPAAEVAAFIAGTGRPLPAHGPGDMPVWGPIFQALETSDPRVKVRIQNIVAYIESIQAR
jgi:mono/diheme cytochrome c family protein